MVGRPRSNEIDAHVGQRMRLRRTLLGMSQEMLGKALGLTFQQVQKYERGTNRIGSSRLFHVSRVLDVPLSFFFDDMQQANGQASDVRLSDVSEAPVDNIEAETMSRRETLELVRAYYRISDMASRKRIFELVKALAEPVPGQKRRGRPRKQQAGEPTTATV